LIDHLKQLTWRETPYLRTEFTNRIASIKKNTASTITTG